MTMYPVFTRRLLPLGLLASALGFPGSLIAQTVTPPDAGQILRENQRPVTPPKSRLTPGLSVPDEKDPKADPSQRLTVSSIKIEGATNIPLTELEPLVADRQGKEQSLGELRAGVRKITAYYRARGFVVARAFIPAQEINNGVLVVQVLEGKLVGSEVINHTAVSDRVLQSVLDAQHLNGKVIVSSTTDRALLLLADLPSVGKVAGKLKPGTEVGTSNLIVTADKGKRVDGLVSVDNYGNRYTGQNRVNGQVEFNSPFGIGDRLSGQATLTDEELVYGRAAYDLPLGGNGFRAGANVSKSSYELGQEFASLKATGDATTAGLFALYPLIRGLNQNIWLTANWEDRDLEDEVKSVNASTEKSASVGTLQLYGDLQDAVGGGGYNTWSISYVAGDLDIETPSALAADQAGPKANGNYHKFVLGASRLQAITEKTSLSFTLAGQTAGKNLDSSEKFVIGGAYGSRAYPQGEGAGDEGWLANLELRHQLWTGFQVGVFYDTGRVDFNESPYTAGENDVKLSSYGLNLNAQYGTINGKLTVAFRDTEKATTAPDKDPRVWASVGYRF